MLISTKGRYALRVLIDMAEHSSQEYIKLSDIADRQEISEKYLESIVRQLVVNKIVTGLRGKGGGYKLAKAPDEIIVGEVLRFMEGSLAPVACMEETILTASRSRIWLARIIRVMIISFRVIDFDNTTVKICDGHLRRRLA